MTTPFTGNTMHRRFQPASHEFRLDLSMVLIDSDLVGGSVPTLAVGPRSTIERRDLLDGDPTTTLGDAVRDLIGTRTGCRPDGPVRTLCIARSGGYVFNPLTVHWALSHEHGRPEAVVLEVTNTPWKERHWYVIDVRDAAEPNNGVAVGRLDDEGTTTARFDKELHVSPFGSMDERYDLSVTAPTDAITVVLRNLDGHDRPVMLARLDLVADHDARTASTGLLFTRRVWFAIHWQALRLLGKRVPVQRHPGRRP